MDYSAALKKLRLPPTLYLAGENDKVLGHPTDIKLLMSETGQLADLKISKSSQLIILGKPNGNLHNYGHNDILTHSDAAKDVYPVALNWLRKNSKLQTPVSSLC